MTLTLTLRTEPDRRVDLSPLLPERLAGLDPGRLALLPLAAAGGPVALGDLFEIEPGDPGELVIAGSSPRLDRIGQGMTGGRIVVEGDAGAYLGFGMEGGSLRLTGSAGPGAATGLRGGLVEIDGDAGERLAGALAGERGMTGGTVVVRGGAGERCGDRMRRGTVIVEGGLGAYAGSRMVAGTIVGLGPAGPWPGFAMRRGTLLLARAPDRLLPSMADCGSHRLGVLTLLVRTYGPLSPALAALGETPRTRRLAGDLAVGGLGEILVAEG